MRTFGLWVLHKIPLAVIVNPFGLLVSILCLASGIPLFIGRIQPQAIEGTLPTPLPEIWGFMLVAGAALTTIGSFIAHRRRVSSASTTYQKGQGVERIGLLIFGYTAAIYAATIVAYAGIQGIQASVLILAFALICWLQAFLIRIQFVLANDLYREFFKIPTPPPDEMLGADDTPKGD